MEGEIRGLDREPQKKEGMWMWWESFKMKEIEWGVFKDHPHIIRITDKGRE
jgi:hypothetical protein